MCVWVLFLDAVLGRKGGFVAPQDTWRMAGAAPTVPPLLAPHTCRGSWSQHRHFSRCL